jgi:hypothetical protein
VGPRAGELIAEIAEVPPFDNAERHLAVVAKRDESQGVPRMLDPQRFAKVACAPRATVRALGQVHAALKPALEILDRSFLPDEMKPRYARLLEARARTLQATARKASGD